MRDPWRARAGPVRRIVRWIRHHWFSLSLEVRGFLIWVIVLLLLAIALWATGCTGMRDGRVLSPDDIAAVVAGVANIEQNETEAGRDVITQAYDQWAPRLDAMRRFVDALRRWSIWLILGIPAATYILPKIVWVLVQRYVVKRNSKETT